jgi:membrane protease YdiL (CAAX protease family)
MVPLDAIQGSGPWSTFPVNMALIVGKIKAYTHLNRFFKKYPKAFFCMELAVYTGLFVLNVWIVPFWLWGIYRLNIAFPEGLKPLFYKLWHGTVDVGFISVTFGLLFFMLSSLIRQDSLKELGIRFDNLYKSGRECTIISLISIVTILFFSIFYSNKSYPQGVISYLGVFSKYTPWGIAKRITEGLAQQFLLQSVFLIRFLQIFGKKSISLLIAAMLFSLAHSPNIRLMFLSFFFGLIVCILFLRNRNILTLGIMHGVLSMVFISFLVPGLVGDFKIGPWRGNTEFIASIDYSGRHIETKPSKTIIIPVSVTNKSTATWDSKDKDHPVFISYHLLNTKGEMVQHDNIRTSFNKRIGTDESVRVDLMINTPSKKGEYYLEVDMVKEKVAWFKNKGSKTILIPLSIN